MAKEIRSFKHLLGKLDGMSDPQLGSAFWLIRRLCKKIK